MRNSRSEGTRGSRGTGTFKYNDPLDNHVIWPGRAAALQSFIQQPYGGMQHKLRNARSSNSEDALTWSCFDALAQLSAIAHRNALADLWELAFGDSNAPAAVHRSGREY